MKANFDEISIQYWLDNRKYIQAKSYSCFHNGYVYGDNMQFDKINFVFVADNNEIIIDGKVLVKHILNLLRLPVISPLKT